MKKSMDRLNPPLSVLFLILAVFIAAADAAETRLIAGGRDAEPFSEILAHRRAEAASKARLLAASDLSLIRRTPNQDLYDVTYYDLVLDLDPTARTLDGVVTVEARVLTPTLTSVSAVTSAGAATGWSRNGDVLTVTLDRSYVYDETVTVAVTYGGNPAGDYFGWSSYGGEHMIWTLSEPFGARDWWPCKDLNTDKADSLDITVTVPDDLVVASNGLLISDVDNGSTRTFHWKTRYPIVTYLVSLAIHPYQTFSTWYAPLDGGDPMEIQHFIYADQAATAPAAYDPVDDMITVFANAFGEYPFVEEKYGHASFVWGGGMEHQTLTSMGGLWHDVISHELTHQWFGDMITCADFHHIWLNEGFAVWGEAYWKEISDSPDTYKAYMSGAAYYGAGTIYVDDLSNVGRIFSSDLSYNKASWVVHMLRGVLGDAEFFDALAHYRDLYAYGSATTEEFRDAVEASSGEDLDAFFQQWIYGEYYPVYAPSYSTADAGGGATNVTLSIEQVQTNTGVFTMPIPVRITTTDGDFDFTVQNDQQTQSWQLQVTGDVLGVAVDPDDWILCMVETTVVDPSLDAGVLLVNGVSWYYGAELRSAFNDSIFTGRQPYDFWDGFGEPGEGYPASLPAPLGHGAVPAEILGRYSTVVWAGNNYNGDLVPWEETPILSYLEAGGNLLLMTRYAESFFDAELAGYLGVVWTGSTGTLSDLVSVHPGIVDEPITGSQSVNSVFQTSVGPNSTLLMTGNLDGSGPYGTGVIAIPPAGGTWRADGGRFALLCGRPYRLDHAARRANAEFILSNFFGEPYSPYADAPVDGTPARPRLAGNYPNPFNPSTTLEFTLPEAARVDLDVYDVSGRRVRTLFSGPARPGTVAVRWDGLDGKGRAVASGTYFARLRVGTDVQVRSMTLVR